MKKLTLLLILLIGSFSYGQVILYQNAPDRQKIAFDSITSAISLENSPPIDISSKENRANKTTDLSSPNNTTYPTTQAVANAIAEVEVGSGVTSQYMDSDKTLEQSDFGKYIYTDESIELTIDNSPAVSSKIGLKVIDIDSTITVKPSSGVVFSGDGQDISEGFIVDSLNLATVFKLASNLYSVDGVYKPYVPPVNLYTLANAANPENEADATTGWADHYGSPTVSSTSSGATPTNGSYYLRFEHDAVDNILNYYRYELTGVEMGDDITVTLDVNRIARPSNSGNAFIIIRSSSGSTLDTTGNLETSPGWEPKTLTATTTTSTTYIEVNFGSTTDTGDVVGVDNIRVIKD